MRSKIFKIVFLLLPISPLVIAQENSGFHVKPYLQYATQNSIRVLWETKEPSNALVYYCEAVLEAKQVIFTDSVQIDELQHMHELELSGLKPETNYFWKAVSKTSSGKTIESELYTFKTVVNDSTAYSFVLIGDPQQNKKNPGAWSQVSKKVWEERPSFVVVAGDLVDWGPNKNEWKEQFLDPGHQLMSRVPLYTVLGNHEGDSDYYYQYMANPEPEFWYTFTYGNSEFFMIDSNRDISQGSEQYNWLEQQLAKSKATWKIAIHHHPPYSSEENDHGDTFNGALSKLGNERVRDLPILFDKYGVDFSLFGHTHVYERTWPLKNNLINQREGTIYINSGGAGGGLEGFAPTHNWFTMKLQSKHHYCTFVVYDKTLIFRAIDDDGRIFDMFQIDKQRDRDAIEVVQPPAPIINSEAYVFYKETTFTIEPGLSNLEIYYTTDGSEPSQAAQKYNGPVTLAKNTKVRARSFTKNGKASREVSKTFTEIVNPISSLKVANSKRGLVYKIYEGNWENKKESFFQTTSVSQHGILNNINLESITPKSEYWGIAIDGYIEVPKTGVYTFYGLGSRGLFIRIDDNEVINIEGEAQETVQLVLEAGLHKLSIQSFQRNWRKLLNFGFYDGALKKRIPFSPFDLSHSTQVNKE